MSVADDDDLARLSIILWNN